ncbi:MAG: hypothetical protein LC744_07460 [Chloroflexi bacterium]|nr:hypothetical protein [Chloroflexota bacterium]
MTQPPSAAERLDHALDGIVAGRAPAVAAAAGAFDPALRQLVTLGGDLRAAMPVPVVAPRFEARLGAKLAQAAQPLDPVAWALRHPGRLIVTGAVGSAVGVGITAFAVWRSARRAPSPAHRLLHR